MSDMTTETCVVEVRRGDTWHFNYSPCGRSAKGQLQDGRAACGTHLRSENLQNAKVAAERAFEERVERVSSCLGVPVWGFFCDQSDKEHPSVSVKLSDLEALAQRLMS